MERCGFGQTAATVRVADGEPGAECQIDFGYLGLLADPVTGQRRKVHALIFTACYSRHMFVWLTFSQTLAALIAGCDAAWEFFGGVFKVVIPDNASAIVADADAVNPRFTVGLAGLRPALRLRHRRRQGPVAERQATGRTGRAVRARELLRRRGFRRPGRRAGPRRAWCRALPGCGSTARSRPARPRYSPVRGRRAAAPPRAL